LLPGFFHLFSGLNLYVFLRWHMALLGQVPGVSLGRGVGSGEWILFKTSVVCRVFWCQESWFFSVVVLALFCCALGGFWVGEKIFE